MRGNKVYILFFCCFSFIGATKAIDLDYYMSSLRNNNCSTKYGLQNCKRLCRELPVLCHEEECYCHQTIIGVLKSPKKLDGPKPDIEVKIIPDTIIVPKESEKDVPEIMLTVETYHPNRRHHIAHFCPDLEVARKCIRTCMKTGKPAFCGKDHTCYCGHRSGPNDPQYEKDASKTYKEFADMYEKYFGYYKPDDSPQEEKENSGE